MKSKYLSALVLTVVFSTTSAVYAQEDSEGTKIGTIVSDAFDAAIPGVSSLVTAIRDIFSTARESRKERADEAIQKAVDDLSNQIKARISDVEPLQTQLATISPFLLFGYKASSDISEIITYLETPGLSAEDYNRNVKPRWARAKANLNLIGVSRTQIQERVKSENLQRVLLGVSDALNPTVEFVDPLISSNVTDEELIEELEKLQNALGQIQVAANIQIDLLVDEIGALANWANNRERSSLSGSSLSIPLSENIATSLQRLSAISDTPSSGDI